MKNNVKMTVKPGLEKEYEEYVSKNDDPLFQSLRLQYGKAVVKAGSSVGKFLDEGKTPKQAHEGMFGYDLTGFQAGCAASAIVHFHPRGEEFKEWWNEYNGGTKGEDGVINPAILTLLKD